MHAAVEDLCRWQTGTTTWTRWSGGEEAATRSNPKALALSNAIARTAKEVARDDETHTIERVDTQEATPHSRDPKRATGKLTRSTKTRPAMQCSTCLWRPGNDERLAPIAKAIDSRMLCDPFRRYHHQTHA
jgi:hypothetical protein